MFKPSSVYILRKHGGWFRRRKGSRVIYIGKSTQGMPPVPPWTRIQQHASGNYHNPSKRKYKRRAKYSKWWFKYVSLSDSTYHWIRIVPSSAKPGKLRWIGSEPLSLVVERILITMFIPMGNIEHNWSYPFRDAARSVQAKVMPKRFKRKFSTVPGETIK